MSDVASLLCIASVGLPGLGALLAGLPGAWWRDDRRHHLIVGSVALAALSSMLPLAFGEITTHTPARWALWGWCPPMGSALPGVSVTFETSPASLGFQIALLVSAGFAVPAAFWRSSVASRRGVCAVMGLAIVAAEVVLLADDLLIRLLAWHVVGIGIGSLRASMDSSLDDEFLSHQPLTPAKPSAVRWRTARATSLVCEMMSLGGLLLLARFLHAQSFSGLFRGTNGGPPAIESFLSSQHPSDQLLLHHGVVAGAAVMLLLPIAHRLAIGPFVRRLDDDPLCRPGCGEFASAVLIPAGIGWMWSLRPLLSSGAMLSSLLQVVSLAGLLAAAWSAYWVESSAVRARLATSALISLWLGSLSNPVASSASATFLSGLLLSGFGPLASGTFSRDSQRRAALAAVAILVILGWQSDRVDRPLRALLASEAAPSITASQSEAAAQSTVAVVGDSGDSKFTSAIQLAALLAGVACLGGAVFRTGSPTATERRPDVDAATSLGGVMWAIVLALGVAPLCLPSISWPVVGQPLQEIRAQLSEPILSPALMLGAFASGAALSMIARPERRTSSAADRARAYRMAGIGFGAHNGILAAAGFIANSFVKVFAWLDDRFWPFIGGSFLPFCQHLAARCHLELQESDAAMGLLAAAFAAAMFALLFLTT